MPRTYERNQPVKVNVADGKSHSHWVTGTYLRPYVRDLHYVQVDGRFHPIGDRFLQPFAKLDDPDAAANFGRANGPEVIRLIHEAMEYLIPPNHHTTATLGDESGIVEVKTVGLYVEPVVIERQSIAGWQEIVAWQVQGFVPTPATRDQPEGGDLANVGDPCASNVGAACILVKTWIQLLTEQHFENVGLNQMIADYERDEREARDYFNKRIAPTQG